MIQKAETVIYDDLGAQAIQCVAVYPQMLTAFWGRLVPCQA